MKITKRKPYFLKAWKDKKNEKIDQRKKGFNPFQFRNHPRQTPQGVTKTTGIMGDQPIEPREPIKY